jgi:hypothetical protein
VRKNGCSAVDPRAHAYGRNAAAAWADRWTQTPLLCICKKLPRQRIPAHPTPEVRDLKNRNSRNSSFSISVDSVLPPRVKLEELLFEILPAGFTEKKKRNKVKNLLTEMRAKDKTIKSKGKGQDHKWFLI